MQFGDNLSIFFNYNHFLNYLKKLLNFQICKGGGNVNVPRIRRHFTCVFTLILINIRLVSNKFDMARVMLALWFPIVPAQLLIVISIEC